MMTSTPAWLCSVLRRLSTDAALPGPPPSAWDRVATLADAEGLAPALAAWLQRQPSDVPPPLAERLSARLRQSAARHVLMSRDLAAVLRALGSEGIPTIPLKGAFLAERVYPRPALRPMSDIDLLIHPDHRVRVDALVRELGYRRGTDAHSWEFDVAYDGATFYDGPGGARLDVHWALLNDPRFPWDRRQAEAVWARAVPITLAGERALALADEDLVVYLAGHLAIHHALAGLVWYWDLALLLDRTGGRLDWDVVARRAERWGLRRALFFVLLRLRALFGCPQDARVLEGLAPRGPRARAVRWLLDHRGGRLRELDHLVPILLADRPGDMVRSLTSALVPPRAWLGARYGREGSWAVYAAHLRRLAAVAGHTGRSLARRGA